MLGVARFVDGSVKASTAERSDVFLQRYDCTKPVCWRADAARACVQPIPYPKGQLQVWHLTRGGFTGKHTDAAAILALASETGGATGAADGATAAAAKVKEEPMVEGSKVPWGKRCTVEGVGAVREGDAGASQDVGGGKRVKVELRKVEQKRGTRELSGLGPMEPRRPLHRGATVTALVSSGPPAPRKPID